MYIFDPFEYFQQDNLHLRGTTYYKAYLKQLGGLSGYTLGVNPFDQPGVEAYKKNMFALLEKPGFEEATKAIKKRLQSKKIR